MALIKSIVDSLKTRVVGRVLMDVFERSNAGMPVTEDTAMRLSAVNACVRVLSEDVAALPLRVYERTKDGGKRRATEHPLYELLNAAPNPEMTAIAFRQALMVNLLLAGDGYAYIEYDRAGRVRALWPLLTSEVTPRRDSGTGQIVYDCAGVNRAIPANDIYHVIGMSYDGLKGLSPISYARESVGTDLAAEKYSGKFFKNGVHLSGVVSAQKPLGPEAYDRTVARFREMFAGLERAHGVAFLEDGATYTPIGVNAKDAQFIETRKFNREQIAAIFRVPPHMIGDLERATFTNIEHQSIEYLQRSLLPWLVRIEQAAMTQLLLPDERKRYLIEHDTGKFLQGDTQSRMTAYKTAIESGIRTVNEARAMDNQEPLPGLDVALLPMNMTMIDVKTGKIIGDTSAAAGGDEDDREGQTSAGKQAARGMMTGLRSAISRRKWEFRAASYADFGIKRVQYEKLEKATRAWLEAQAEGVLSLLAGTEEKGASETGIERRAKRKYTYKHLVESLNSYYRAVAHDGADALAQAVEDGVFPDWKDMTEALDGMARDAWAGVADEMGGTGVGEEWMRGFMKRYAADMGTRLSVANYGELERAIRRAENAGDDAFEALEGALGRWHNSDKAATMANNEVAMCVNEAKIAGYRKAGYQSIWISGANCCPACQRLNGVTVTTLKPPLHTGCTCTVRAGEKTADASLQSPGTDGKLTEGDLPEWLQKNANDFRVSVQKQNRHRKGTAAYARYAERLGTDPSYLLIDYSDERIEQFIRTYAGTGKVTQLPDGQIIEELTDTDFDGVVVNNLTGETDNTKNIKVHYAGTSVHIVPDYRTATQKGGAAK